MAEHSVIPSITRGHPVPRISITRGHPVPRTSITRGHPVPRTSITRGHPVPRISITCRSVIPSITEIPDDIWKIILEIVLVDSDNYNHDRRYNYYKCIGYDAYTLIKLRQVCYWLKNILSDDRFSEKLCFRLRTRLNPIKSLVEFSKVKFLDV